MLSALVFPFLALTVSAQGLPSGHLKIMMFYDFDWDHQKKFTNVISGDGASLEDMLSTGVPGMPTLPDTVFDRASHGLFPGWKDATDAFVSAIKPHFANGSVIGVFLGDEICCSGVPLENLTSVVNHLRQSLGSKAILYTNECAVMDKWPSVPAGLDYISIDFYDEHNTNGTHEVELNRQYYNNVIFPKLHPHQGILFVPGIFASDPKHCAEGNQSCPLGAQAEQIVQKLDGFFEWAKQDTRVAGFNPWHFANRSLPQLKGWWDQRLGAVSMPSVVAKLNDIGQYIMNQGKEQAGLIV